MLLADERSGNSMRTLSSRCLQHMVYYFLEVRLGNSMPSYVLCMLECLVNHVEGCVDGTAKLPNCTVTSQRMDKVLVYSGVKDYFFVY